ncbi:hypothetical protein BCV71DRAFT_189365, partial [Rhizopus microsporus]
DSVAFLVNNKNVTSMLVELSGGMDFNIGLDKVKSDEEKIIKQFYIKRTLVTVPCLSTPFELKKFVETIPGTFRYRQDILDQINKLEYEYEPPI